MPQPAAGALHHPPAGVLQAGIEAQEATLCAWRHTPFARSCGRDSRSADRRLRPRPRNWHRRSARRRCRPARPAASAPRAPCPRPGRRGRSAAIPRLALSGLPKPASSASRTAKKSSAAQVTSWPSSSRSRHPGAGLDRRLQHRLGLVGLAGIADHAHPLEHGRRPSWSRPARRRPWRRRLRTSPAVRLRLSVSASTITATPSGP